MLSQIKKQLEKLQQSEEFKSSKEKGYLCSVFIMVDFSILKNKEQNQKLAWQFDFYNKEKDTITSYISEPEIKKVNDESEVYKEEKEKILQELKLTSNFIEFEKILSTAESSLIEQKETPNKTIIILQINNSKPLWNLSFVTNNFNLINIKIDALNSEILENKKVELLNWNSKENNN